VFVMGVASRNESAQMGCGCAAFQEVCEWYPPPWGVAGKNGLNVRGEMWC
jgi:hypothetical protein